MNKRNTNNRYYALRWKILQRDKFCCQYCGQHAPNVKLEVDHIVPVADGGTDDENNLIACCYACNRGKSGLQIIMTRKMRGILSGNVQAGPYITVETTQDKVFKFVGENPGTSPNSVRQALGVSYGSAAIALHRLLVKGKVIHISWGKYQVVAS